MSVVSFNPCLDCGACCATYRVSFYWAEADPELGGSVPPELTEPLSAHRVAMSGTNGPRPRCIALEGTVGEKVRCTIYPNRASVCREFGYAGEGGEPNERCDQARAVWGLAPLAPAPIEPDTPISSQAA